jgi:2'-5' RNA ligase
MNEIVIPGGVQIGRYYENNPVLWCHRADEKPIANGLRPREGVLSDGRKTILLDLHFHRVTDESREINDLVNAGAIKSGSIGFLPLTAHDEPAKNYRDAYPFLDTVRVYDTWELLEFSLCNIPMNPGALVQHAFATDPDFDARIRDAIHRGVIPSDGAFVRRCLGALSIPDVATKDTTTTRTPITTTKSAMTHDCSCAMLALADADASAILDFAAATIADGDLAPKGREDEPHITVLYGIATSNVKVMTALLSDVPPITVTLGEVSVFEGGGDDDGSRDVVKIDVVGRELVELNEMIESTIETDDNAYGSYNPHITLAYVKPGRGAQYAGPCDLTGMQLTFDTVAFSAADGTTTIIPLGGSPTETTTKTMRSRTKAPAPVVADPNAPAVDPNAVPVAADPAPAPVAAEAEPPEPNEPTGPTPEDAPMGPMFDLALMNEYNEEFAEIAAMSALAAVKSQNTEVQAFALEVIDVMSQAKDKVQPLLEAAQAVIDASTAPAVDPNAPPVDPNAPGATDVATAATVDATAPTKMFGFSQKAGRVISAANAAHVTAIYDAASALKAAMDAGSLTEEDVTAVQEAAKNLSKRDFTAHMESILDAAIAEDLTLNDDEVYAALGL